MPTLVRINHQKSVGAAMVEFAIVLPLMMLLFSGLLEIGRVLSQLNWLSQTAFSLITLHGGTPKDYAPQLVSVRFDRLKTAKLNEFSKVGLTVNYPEPLFGDSYYRTVNEAEVVGMKLSATIRPLTTILGFTIPVSIEVTGPFLIPDKSNAGNLGQFQNPSPYLYDCSGRPCTNGKWGRDCRGYRCF